MIQMWEILVPTVYRVSGKPIHTRYHRVWDEKVRKISGGLTVMHPVKGQWVHEDQLHSERMIPVRILATKEQMEEIVTMTIQYYDQLAVLAYRISTDIMLRHHDGKGDI